MNGSSNRTSNFIKWIKDLYFRMVYSLVFRNILELNILRHYQKIMRGVIDNFGPPCVSSRVFGSLKGILFRYLVKESIDTYDKL